MRHVVTAQERNRLPTRPRKTSVSWKQIGNAVYSYSYIILLSFDDDVNRKSSRFHSQFVDGNQFQVPPTKIE